MTEHECSRNAKGVNSGYSLPEWLAGMQVGEGRVLPCQQGSPTKNLAFPVSNYNS